MSFIEQYRLDLGLGGTSFGYEVRNTMAGEIFNCYGNGTIDQLFIPNDINEIVVTHSGFGEDVMHAKYTFHGNLIEVGVFVKSYYDQFIEMDGIYIGPSVKKDINSLTNDGAEPALLYINLAQKVIGYISGDDPEPTNNYYSESQYVTEFPEGGVVIPTPTDFGDDPDEPESDEYVDIDLEDKDIITFSIDKDNLNMHFRLNSDDFITQPIKQSIDLTFLKGVITPKHVKDLVEGVFLKNRF